MLSFSVIMFHSAIEIGLYSLYRKKVISAFKLNKKVAEEKTMICLSQAKSFEKAIILYM